MRTTQNNCIVSSSGSSNTASNAGPMGSGNCASTSPIAPRTLISPPVTYTPKMPPATANTSA
ncbi:hypothetical protein VB773_11625 [Haloarculaceae archaeon H-GB2-1]|nr:hypothetical protein [Haloarculaceae archaeon H-GB2-1]